MKAILTSTSITNIEGGVEQAEKMIGKSRSDINIAVINEASAVEFCCHRWAISTLTGLAENFGGNIEIVHLFALSPEKIRERLYAADMVFVLGGNTEWLKIVFDKTGVSGLIPEILKDKLYIGSSAGSMIIGRQPSYKNQGKGYGATDFFGVESYLNLVDFAMLPHFDSKTKDCPRGLNWAIDESKSIDCPVYALSDSAAVVINGSEIYQIGEDYLKLINGEISERG